VLTAGTAKRIQGGKEKNSKGGKKVGGQATDKEHHMVPRAGGIEQLSGGRPQRPGKRKKVGNAARGEDHKVIELAQRGTWLKVSAPH